MEIYHPIETDGNKKSLNHDKFGYPLRGGTESDGIGGVTRYRAVAEHRRDARISVDSTVFALEPNPP